LVRGQCTVSVVPLLRSLSLLKFALFFKWTQTSLFESKITRDVEAVFNGSAIAAAAMAAADGCLM